MLGEEKYGQPGDRERSEQGYDHAEYFKSRKGTWTLAAVSV